MAAFIDSAVSFDFIGWSPDAGAFENLVPTGAGNTSGIANSLSGNANSLSGNAGDNLPMGMAGDDTLPDGNGNDRLSGGLGKDALTGGAGSDQFVFDAKAKGNADIICDFAHGADRIRNQRQGLPGHLRTPTG